jgi:succinate dehydrogenase/fumarate reductase flavoprotein subunit
MALDVLVIGGGNAALCAALMAAKQVPVSCCWSRRPESGAAAIPFTRAI